MKEVLLQQLGYAGKVIDYFEKKTIATDPKKGVALQTGRLAFQEKASVGFLKQNIRETYLENETAGVVEIADKEAKLASLPNQLKLTQQGRPRKYDDQLRALEECVPCNTRLFFKTQFKLEGKLLDSLTQNAWDRVQRLNGLVDLRQTSRSLALDLCQLLRFLVDHCGPDLNRLAILLGFFQRQLMQFKDIGLPSSLALLGILFMPFQGLINISLDKLKRLVADPLLCLQTTLGHALERSQSTLPLSSDGADVLKAYNSTLKLLDNYVKDSYNHIDAAVQRAEVTLQEWLTLEAANYKDIQRTLRTIEEIQFLIGIINMLIKLKLQADFKKFCGNTEQLLEVLVLDNLDELNEHLLKDGRFVRNPDTGHLGILPDAKLKHITAEDFEPIKDRIPATVWTQLPDLILSEQIPASGIRPQSPQQLHCFEELQLGESEQVQSWLKRINQN